MSEAGVHRFVAVVALHFPRPKFNDDEVMEGAWIASMNRVLSGYSDEVLAEAAQRILAQRNPKRDGKFFPVPSECSDVCTHVAKLQEMQRTPLLSYGHRDSSPWAGWRMQLADELINGEMGRQAAEEGWVLILHDFVRNNGRMPTGNEIARCRQDAKVFDEAYAECVRGHWQGNGQFVQAAFVKLGDSMVARRDDLAKAVAT